jgi:hypothetical protein
LEAQAAHVWSSDRGPTNAFLGNNEAVRKNTMRPEIDQPKQNITTSFHQREAVDIPTIRVAGEGTDN